MVLLIDAIPRQLLSSAILLIRPFRNRREYRQVPEPRDLRYRPTGKTYHIASMSNSEVIFVVCNVHPSRVLYAERLGQENQTSSSFYLARFKLLPE